MRRPFAVGGAYFRTGTVTLASGEIVGAGLGDGGTSVGPEDDCGGTWAAVTGATGVWTVWETSLAGGAGTAA
jgi:hypothetical protein